MIKNKLKKLYLIIPVFLLFSCGTTSLKGIYCHSFNGGFDSTCLTFQDNKNFYYETSGDLGTYQKGKGKYDLQDKILKLRFEKDSVIQKSQVNAENWSYRDEEHADSINLIFKVYDAYNKELPLYATIFEESKDLEYVKENTVNSNGALTITKPKSSKTEKYRIGFIGYETLEVGLKHDSTQEIKVNLYPVQPQPISDTTHTYILKNIRKDYFLTSKDHMYRKLKK